MKHSLMHHKGVIGNIRSSIKMVEDEILGLLVRIERGEQNIDEWNAEIEFLEHQIAEAEKQGKNGFDSNTFCRPRKRKGDAK